MLPPPARRPISTYRIQFTPEFNFEAGRELIPYLVELGVTELYSSPLFQASLESSHGYDVNDYTTISRSLGGMPGLEKMSANLRAHNLGLLLDFVPNHMGIDGEYNAWWRHVLENGAQSKYAAYFDVEWHPRLEYLNDRVLVPMLDRHYGRVLEEGRLVLSCERGRFLIRYAKHVLPLRPRSYRLVLDQIDQLLPSGDPRKSRLRDLAEAFENLPPHDPEERELKLKELQRDWAKMLEADPSLNKLLETTIQTINGKPGNPASFARLHELLELQHFRLAYWKVGAHEVNYRRFFAVDTLVGLRMENTDVFAATHELIGSLIGQGMVTGIRLDHIDGLWNPRQYLQRLAEMVRQRNPEGAPLYTLVEKILAPGESLPQEWEVHGTSGYEFATSLIELFLDRGDEKRWTQIYGEFTGEAKSSLELTYEDKLFALQEIFPNAVSNLATELDALIEPDWHKRDLSLHDLKTGLRHFLASLQVYRTYRMPGEAMAESEKKFVRQAVEDGIRRNPCVDPTPIRFIGSVLTGEYPPAQMAPERQEGFARWICKLQQATGAVMAKSVEDTHFYRYVRMFGANEVGSHPSRFGQPIEQFHRANRERLEQQPYCLLTTSTHDTKLSEDARARLFALAELPEEWNERLRKWHDLNAPLREEIEHKAAPDAREEYLLYQVLLAAFPLDASHNDEKFRQRMRDYFRKAQGEAKLNTSWTFPHERWLAAGGKFIDRLLQSEEFLADFVPFANRIAERGMFYSLSQTVLHLTSPGVPDIYQGNEVWDFSLVDPDNRRPVDFELRKNILQNLDKRSPAELLQNWRDGGIKLLITRALLRCRRELPELFLNGNYAPLSFEGKDAAKFVGFVRSEGSSSLCVIVKRCVGENSPTASCTLPESGSWENVLTGRPAKLSGPSVDVGTALDGWPVAVLLVR